MQLECFIGDVLANAIRQEKNTYAYERGRETLDCPLTGNTIASEMSLDLQKSSTASSLGPAVLQRQGHMQNSALFLSTRNEPLES